MRFYVPDFDAAVLPETEAQHCLKVLRKNVGDSILVTNGSGQVATATLTSANVRKCTLSLGQAKNEEKGWKGERWLAVAPTKQQERMEWMVEKCTEIGVDGIFFVLTSRTERSYLKLERLEKAAISAMKQSGQAWLPVLRIEEKMNSFPFHEFEQMLIGDLAPAVGNHIPPVGSKSVLWIGPEGDFTPEEMALLYAKGAKGIRLAPHVLRTETAAIFGLALLHLGQPK